MTAGRPARGEAAWLAGMRDGHVLLAVDGQDAKQMHGNSRDQAIGRRHRVKVRRGGAEHDLTLVVAPRAMQKRVLQVHEAPARSSAGA